MAGNLRSRCGCAALAGIGFVAIFTMAKSGCAAALTTLHVFCGSTDGGNPEGGLIIDKNGVLYGTTDIGGGTAGNAGTIFSLTPPTSTGGIGACTDSSEGGCGVVFQLAPPKVAGANWRETLLHRFIGGSDGAAGRNRRLHRYWHR